MSGKSGFREFCPADGFRRGDFTLVELLTVIAIISVLAGMLLPALQKSVDQAYALACLNKLKQVAQGLQLYVDDSGGCYPYYMVTRPTNPAADSCTRSGYMEAWPKSLFKYLDTTEICFCAKDPKLPGRPKRPTDNPTYLSSYLYRYAIGTAAEVSWRRSLKTSDFKYASQQVIFPERHDWHGKGIGMWTAPLPSMDWGYIPLSAAYVDGHVKNWKMTYWSTGYSNFDCNWFIDRHGAPDGSWNPRNGSD